MARKPLTTVDDTQLHSINRKKSKSIISDLLTRYRASCGLITRTLSVDPTPSSERLTWTSYGPFRRTKQYRGRLGNVQIVALSAYLFSCPKQRSENVVELARRELLEGFDLLKQRSAIVKSSARKAPFTGISRTVRPRYIFKVTKDGKLATKLCWCITKSLCAEAYGLHSKPHVKTYSSLVF